VGWAGKRAERVGTSEVLAGRPGNHRELGGAEVMEAKMGKLESGVHPLKPQKIYAKFFLIRVIKYRALILSNLPKPQVSLLTKVRHPN
jgi:hypothetical protein